MRTRLAVIPALLALVSSTVLANRVFVSTNGMDTGTCTITSPCRTFAYGVTQLSPPGEMIALDTGGYGPFTISITATVTAAPGATAFIASSSDAIDVTAGPDDRVTLRGLALTAQTGGSTGVAFIAGRTLNVENCVINGFNGAAIIVNRTGDTTKPRLNVINSVMRNNANGVYLLDVGPGLPGAGPSADLVYATIANSALIDSASAGIHAADNARVSVIDTVITGGMNWGILADASQDFSVPEVNLEHCQISRNTTGILAGSTGAASQNPRGLVRLANCAITANDTGVSANTDGQILSRVAGTVMTNTLSGNGTDGSMTGTYAAK